MKKLIIFLTLSLLFPLDIFSKESRNKEYRDFLNNSFNVGVDFMHLTNRESLAAELIFELMKFKFLGRVGVQFDIVQRENDEEGIITKPWKSRNGLGLIFTPLIHVNTFEESNWAISQEVMIGGGKDLIGYKSPYLEMGGRIKFFKIESDYNSIGLETKIILGKELERSGYFKIGFGFFAGSKVNSWGQKENKNLWTDMNKGFFKDDLDFVPFGIQIQPQLTFKRGFLYSLNVEVKRYGFGLTFDTKADTKIKDSITGFEFIYVPYIYFEESNWFFGTTRIKTAIGLEKIPYEIFYFDLRMNPTLVLPFLPLSCEVGIRTEIRTLEIYPVVGFGIGY